MENDANIFPFDSKAYAVGFNFKKNLLNFLSEYEINPYFKYWSSW